MDHLDRKPKRNAHNRPAPPGLLLLALAVETHLLICAAADSSCGVAE